ncbi:hypothetical protein OSB04_013204 [Centaurea solstitialis]|uniref:Uncharacterized protein n=1 Tax=Centaurea solstitialis TaxID=347529 RepID=A0AA38WN53_9ASTR|nr:hypothetical protein OSB04_013204 [Centaurea solstitialis]
MEISVARAARVAPNTRDIELVVEQRVEREVTPEYTPSTPFEEYPAEEDQDEEYPTEEDPYEEEARMLYREIERLRDELSRSQEETSSARDTTRRFENWNADREVRLSALDFQNVCLRGTIGFLKEENRELKGELRIARRSWRTRVGDRTRYYGATVSEYFGLVREYVGRWRYQFQQGPSLRFLWSYRPVRTYEEEIRAAYYPRDMSTMYRYVKVIVPKTFLHGIEVAKIVKKSSDRPTKVGRGVKRKWEDNSKRSKIAKFGSGLKPKGRHIRSNCPKLQKDTALSMRLESGASKSGNTTKEVPKAKGTELG